MLECNNLSSFVTAVQLAERGAMDEARKLWEQVCTDEYFEGDDDARENLGPLRANPRLLLAHCIYRYLDHFTLADQGNLKSVLEKLLLLKKEFPVLFSDDPKSFHCYRRSQFIRDLELTVHARKAPEGSVEALLVDWGNRTGLYAHLGFFDEHNSDCHRPGGEIFLKGASAIPELARLIEDRRLTRYVRPAKMMAPEERVRLGQLANELLAEMIGEGERSAAEAIGNDADAERRFFEKAAVKVVNAKIAGFDDVPLWVLGQKYPNRSP